MRRVIYGVIGITIGIILYVFMYTNTPAMKELSLVNYQKPNYEEQDLREVRGGVTTFLEDGSYHINTMEYDAYENRGVVKYGKNNPMFHYIHSQPEPEQEEITEVQTEGPLRPIEQITITEKDPLGIGSREPIKPIDFINGENTMGFNTVTGEFEETDVAFQLYDFSITGKLPLDREHYNLTSSFGTRVDPFTNKQSFHSGMDFASNEIDGSSVYSISHGEVIAVNPVNEDRPNEGYGNHVIVQHNNYKSLYAHLSSFSEIEVGDYVTAGAVLGKNGTTGRSTGPHLHLEVIIGESLTVDPALFLNRVREVE